jgi:hypothetical protein
MSRKLVRSGVQHSVTFNAATRNAVSPKYELKEGEPIPLDLKDATDPSKKTKITDTSFSEGKTHIKSNMQKIDVDGILEDNIQSVGTNKHYKDNIQKFDDAKPIIDNWQKIRDVSNISQHHLISEQQTVQNLKNDRKPQKAVARVVRQIKADLPDKESSPIHDDELQAKIRRIKKKLQNANQKLKNIQENNQ